MNKKNTIVKWRIYLVLIGFLLVTLVIVAQLYRIQIIHGENYSNRADKQHIRPTANIFDRGSIYFTDKDGNKIDAAGLKTGYTIAISPKNIIYPEDVFNNLGFHLDIDEEFYASRAEKSDDPYEEIAKRVPYDVGQSIFDLNMEGVSVIKENWRFYPGKDLAAHALGFISWNKDELRGQYGLERYYEETLQRNHDAVFSNFFAEIFSNTSDVINNKKNLEGSLVTTINPEVQNFVQDEIKVIQNEWNSKQIGIVVMRPDNGEIVSMGLYPDFDLNEFSQVENVSVYQNHLVESVYEMGSIVKPLTVAIGLDNNSITPDTTYNDKGSLTLNNYTIYNYDKKARGVVNMQEILNQSLNLGVSFIVSEVGNDKFAEYMKNIFSGKTAIDLPNESAPLIANLDSPRDIELATASFGQGIAMSPIAITRALATLGNGGKLVQPHLVKEIEYELGFAKEISITDPVQIFKPETSEEISRMLVKVVDDALRGGTVALNNHSIAAKTGTAQIASPDGGYYEDKYLHSFFGYFPAYEPEYLVFLYHIEPQGARYASETLTEPFMNITKFLINHYEIRPDRDIINEQDEGNN